jgi:hypothetical protein
MGELARAEKQSGAAEDPAIAQPDGGADRLAAARQRRALQRKQEREKEKAQAEQEKADPQAAPPAEEAEGGQETEGAEAAEEAGPVEEVEAAQAPAAEAVAAEGDSQVENPEEEAAEDEEERADDEEDAVAETEAQELEAQLAAPPDVENPKDGGDAAEEDEEPVKEEEVTGIASQLRIDSFLAQARDMEINWEDMAPEERATSLVEAANTQLQAVDAYPTIVPPNLVSMDDNGQLDFREWQIKLNQDRFEAETIESATAGDVAATVYHESRHAEQWHRMARMLAQQGKTPRQIKKKLSIPEFVAADAAEKPLDMGSKEGQEAKAFHGSVYGKGKNARNRTLEGIERAGKRYEKVEKRRAKAQKKLDQVNGNPKSTAKQKARAQKALDKADRQLAKQYALWKKAYAKYLALPEEGDANKVGDAVQDQSEVRPSRLIDL